MGPRYELVQRQIVSKGLNPFKHVSFSEWGESYRESSSSWEGVGADKERRTQEKEAADGAAAPYRVRSRQLPQGKMF